MMPQTHASKCCEPTDKGYEMNSAETTLGALSEDAAYAHDFEILLEMQGDFLAAFEPTLSAMFLVFDESTREQRLRRFAKRLFCVERFRVLRCSTWNVNVSSEQLAKQIDSEAKQIDPTWRCTWRSLQDWRRAWNRVGVDGTAHGWRGLVRPCGTIRRKNCSRGRGRRSIRSPEAIVFWNRLYLDGFGQSIATCHRKTLAEAQRRGWGWPREYSTTRQWVAARRRKGRPASL